MEKPIEKALDECLFFSVKKLDRLLNKLADEAFRRSEEHTSELQSPNCISYAVFCLKKKKYSDYVYGVVKGVQLVPGE